MSNLKAPIVLPVLHNTNESAVKHQLGLDDDLCVSHFEQLDGYFFKIDAIVDAKSFDKEVTQINVSGTSYFVPLPKSEVFEKVMKWMAIDGYKNNVMIKEFKEFYRFQ